MPLPKYKRKYKYKKKFNYKRRKYRALKRAKKAWSKPLRSVRVGRGFPDKMVINHKYSQVVRINALADLLGTQLIFWANGMHNPMQVPPAARTTQVPLMKDQLEPLYNHYTILGSKITIKVAYDNNSAAEIGTVIPKGPVEFILLRNDSTSTSPVGTMRAVREQNACVHRILPGTHIHSNAILATAHASYSAKTVFGADPVANTSLRCLGPNGDPSEGYYFLAYFRNTGTEAVPIVVWIDIEYSAVWYERADIPSSTDSPST